MGIHDRDYSRPNNRWSDSLPPFTPSGFVHSLLGLLIFFFFLQVLSGNKQVLAEGLMLQAPLVWPGGQVWRIATYFLVQNISDLLGFVVICLVLWTFGKMVEEEIGSLKTGLLYFGSVVIGGLVYCAMVWLGIRKESVGCLGAAGGVTAIMVLAAWRNPNATVYLLGRYLPVQLWVAVVLFVAIEALLFTRQPGLVLEMHLMGALVGTLVEWSGRWNWDPFAGYQNWKRSLFGPKLRVFRDENARRARRETPVRVSTKKEALNMKKEELVNPSQDEEMDRILEKISKSGLQSLSDEEKKFLLSASDRIKNQKKSR